MAIESALSYLISEERDGFVAVDFDLTDGHDDDWEIVDDCSSDDDVDFTSSSVQSDVSEDEISVEDLKSMPDYSPEMFISHRHSTAADVIEYVTGGAVEEVDGGGDSENLFENGVDLHELFAGEDSKPAPEMIIGQRLLDYELPWLCDYEYANDNDYDRREEEDDDYDLDDELVPYSAKVKLGRERMRKLGKRSCSKLVKSKRLTYNYNKAGCFRGKHGLGLKHSLI